MDILRVASMPFYLIAMLCGHSSRFLRRLGLDFIDLGDYVSDGHLVPLKTRVRNLGKKWKNINNRME